MNAVGKIKKNGALLLTAIVLMTGMAGLFSKPVSADAATTKSYSFSFKNLVTLQGAFGSNDYYFTIDKHWDVQSVTLHLDISQSQRIDPDGLSSMTIFLNGQPVNSFALQDHMADHSLVDIPLDTSKIINGSNTVRVQVYHRVSDQPCADDVSPSTWVNINGGSAVNVQYTDHAPAMRLSEYPYPFYRMQQNTALNTAVTVGSLGDKQELAAALEVESAFGHYADPNDVTLQTVPLGDLQNREDQNIIFIGKSSDAPSQIKSLFPQNTDFSSGAWFKVAPSPYNPGHVLLAVLADKDADLERASQFLQNSALVSQVDSDLYHLDSSVNVATKDTSTSSSYTFTQLGYDGVYLYGPFRKTTTLNIKLPKSRVLDGSSTITLHFRYSKNLDFTRSLATIYMNNIPIGSQKLTEEKADSDSLTLTIPAEARSGNYFSLKIAFDLEMTNQWCIKRDEETPWAYIVGDSSVYMPTTQVLTNMFQNLSSPFVVNQQWNNTTFVLPQNAQASDLNLAGQIALLMGHDIQSNHGSLHVTTGDQNDSTVSASNLIVFGTPQRQPLIRTNNKNLFFPYNNSFTYFLSNEKMELLSQKSQTLTSFQLLDSPYNGKNAMLVLTAPNETNLNNAIQSLFLSSSIGKLLGDGALIETQGTIHNFRFKKDTVSTPQFWNGNLSDPNTRLFFLMAAFVVALIVIILILRWRKNRKIYLRLENKIRQFENYEDTFKD